tara:strand:- start:2298 stop:2522 length:225 start_codon:yes stop_codon:yes gene_type:complete
MGLLKRIVNMFKCKSKCSFNEDNFIEKGLENVDLSQYRLKRSDKIAIEKIVMKRPSINTYVRENKLKILDITEI